MLVGGVRSGRSAQAACTCQQKRSLYCNANNTDNAKTCISVASTNWSQELITNQAPNKRRAHNRGPSNRQPRIAHTYNTDPRVEQSSNEHRANIKSAPASIARRALAPTSIKHNAAARRRHQTAALAAAPRRRKIQKTRRTEATAHASDKAPSASVC